MRNIFLGQWHHVSFTVLVDNYHRPIDVSNIELGTSFVHQICIWAEGSNESRQKVALIEDVLAWESNPFIVPPLQNILDGGKRCPRENLDVAFNRNIQTCLCHHFHCRYFCCFWGHLWRRIAPRYSDRMGMVRHSARCCGRMGIFSSSFLQL